MESETVKCIKTKKGLTKLVRWGNDKLHKLTTCELDYDSAQMWINPNVPTHTGTLRGRDGERKNTRSVIVSNGQKTFQCGGNPVIPQRLGFTLCLIVLRSIKIDLSSLDTWH